MEKKSLLQMGKELVGKRQLAYQRVFDKDLPYAPYVLQDLAKFCRAHETTFSSDERVHAILEGRREVWLRIQTHLNLTQEQLWELYGRKDLPNE